jgi:SLOG in TRPM, prokaryote
VSAPGPQVVRVTADTGLADSLHTNGIATDRPVLVCIGGAAGLSDELAATLTATFQDFVAPALDQWSATVVDGGTDSGVMRMMGQAKARAGALFPLVGVAAAGTVALPGVPSNFDDAAPLEPHHTHVVLIPGDNWGDETPWISAVAGEIARGRQSVTLMVNGGSIALQDAQTCVDAGRPLLVLAGSGRSADEIAGAWAGAEAGEQAKAIAANPLTSIVDAGDPPGILRSISQALGVDAQG